MTSPVSSPSPTKSGAAPLWVFGILFLSYAFFWQSRDWNSASRLMMTYAIVDRGTIAINGLENQTGDKALFQSRFYTDKLPGFSLLAVAPYWLAKTVFQLPPHPLLGPALAYWPADYWVTLLTSSLASALTGALLTLFASRLGCGPRRAAIVGLAYGLATPAYAYATMSYGHQVSACCLFASFLVIIDPPPRRPAAWAGLAGFLAALAAVVELQVGPVSALLGLALLVQVIGRRVPASALLTFAIGATVPTLVLLGYNLLAFGSPFDMGYFHHATRQFAQVHSHRNPLGLRSPDWSLAPALLWGRYRGLAFYAPVVLLAPAGWLVLAFRRKWGVAAVSLAACVAVFLVNLSYPEWTGGWSTGPRLLVPLLPFALVPVAALLALESRWITLLALGLALFGGALMLGFLAVGGRIPHTLADPFTDAVWPLWRGDRVPFWWPGQRFTRNLAGLLFPHAFGNLPACWQWVQFLPLVVLQAVAVCGMTVALGKAARPVLEVKTSQIHPRPTGARDRLPPCGGG
jgi:hypothetical protein